MTYLCKKSLQLRSCMPLTQALIDLDNPTPKSGFESIADGAVWADAFPPPAAAPASADRKFCNVAALPVAVVEDEDPVVGGLLAPPYILWTRGVRLSSIVAGRVACRWSLWIFISLSDWHRGISARIVNANICVFLKFRRCLTAGKAFPSSNSGMLHPSLRYPLFLRKGYPAMPKVRPQNFVFRHVMVLFDRSTEERVFSAAILPRWVAVIN